MALTWLHISDLHIREGDPYDRNVVLKALVNSVRKFRESGHKPDVIFVTGDIAHSGKADQYELATEFFDDLRRAADLPKQRLYVVPGNHDVDRGLGIGLARTMASGGEADKYFAPETPKNHLMQKQGAFLRWHNAYFDGIRKVPDDTTCGSAEALDLGGLKLGVLLINSALFAQEDDDHRKLWIGRRCLDRAIEALDALKADVSVALMHHPLDWLHDEERSNIEAKLEKSVDIILRGHLHETSVKVVVSYGDGVLHVAAGAAYRTRKRPNRSLYATIENGGVTIFPIRYEDKPNEVWVLDTSVYPDEPDYQKRYPLSRLSGKKPETSSATRIPRFESASEYAFCSNIPALDNLPFVGRDDLLKEVLQKLGEPSKRCVLVLHGHSGVGKSELAREFGRQHRGRYPGGTYIVDASAPEAPRGLAQIGQTILKLDFPDNLSPENQFRVTLYTLGKTPFLLIYDDVRDFSDVPSDSSIQNWLPPHGMPCHVLMTTFLDPLDNWLSLKVDPLSKEAASKLIEAIAGPEIAERYGEEIQTHAQGLPVQIRPEAKAFAYEQRRGRLDSATVSLASEAQESFRRPYGLLDDSARLLLHTTAFLNSRGIIRDDLLGPMDEAKVASRKDLERALDACLDLHLLEGTAEIRMHQLLAEFVRGTPLMQEEKTTLTHVRIAQGKRMLELARKVRDSPADLESAARLLVFPLRPEAWEDAGAMVSADEGQTVGGALIDIGRFAEALPWYERAVEAAEKGDIHGRVDNESLGASLHQVGYCLACLGKFKEALPGYERAVEAIERGDIHGRVDNESLGTSLNNMGDCLHSLGKFAEALPWYERAVEAAEKGDIHGRVDNESLGRSLNNVGSCLDSLGKFAEALPWHERAAEAAEKGDIHGRVDNESLGASLNNVGYCLGSLGKFAEALPWHERAVEAAEKGDIHGRVGGESLGTGLNNVGYCLQSLGKFADALPWYERAVEAAEKGDIHGRVDNASLGSSLHQVGYCLQSLEKFAEAIPWHERAVEAKERGDIHGRVDNESLGNSLHQVGYCLESLGKFADALPWYERAVEAAERGDIHGRVDNESLGKSLHQVGYCHESLGKFADAIPWYERAVEAKEKGDIHGRVDNGSLGESLHQVGYCLGRLGKFAEALPWYERAVEAMEKGDIHGRVDNESLGRSLNQVGYCLQSLGKLADALPWYERAVEATEKGDIHGRVDHESLGNSLHQVGYCLDSLGKFAEALPWYERAVEAAEKGDIYGRVDNER